MISNAAYFIPFSIALFSYLFLVFAGISLQHIKFDGEKDEHGISSERKMNGIESNSLKKKH